MLNLASDPKEHFNLDLHIILTNNRYWLAKGISYPDLEDIVIMKHTIYHKDKYQILDGGITCMSHTCMTKTLPNKYSQFLLQRQTRAIQYVGSCVQ